MTKCKSDKDLEQFVRIAMFLSHRGVGLQKTLVHTNEKGKREVVVWIKNPTTLLSNEGELHKRLLSKMRKYFDEVVYIKLKFENQIVEPKRPTTQEVRGNCASCKHLIDRGLWDTSCGFGPETLIVDIDKHTCALWEKKVSK